MPGPEHRKRHEGSESAEQIATCPEWVNLRSLESFSWFVTSHECWHTADTLRRNVMIPVAIVGAIGLMTACGVHFSRKAKARG
jgi:hypothetical protein